MNFPFVYLCGFQHSAPYLLVLEIDYPYSCFLLENTLLLTSQRKGNLVPFDGTVSLLYLWVR